MLPVIDLILATVARTAEPVRFVRSLDAQTYRAFRLIVVDQNPHSELERLLDPILRPLPYVYLRSEPGLSKARNAGLRHVEGDIVAFPDDDCWYPADTLERVAAFFATHSEWEGLSGQSVDESGRPSGGRWDRRAGRITPNRVWTRAGSYTIFLRRSLVEAVGPFDESLGLGANSPWPSAEDLDYVLRGVQLGRALYYDPSLHVHHPQTREGLSEPDAANGFHHGMGMGRVMRTNGLPAWLVAYHVARSFGGSAISLARGDRALARFYWAVGRGRLRGWRSSRTSS